VALGRPATPRLESIDHKAVLVLRRLKDALGHVPLASIRPRHIAEYVATTSADYGAATVSMDVSLLHAIFASAKREELVESNPAERAERPTLPRRRWRILEPVEVTRVAKEPRDEQARAVFLTLVLTGIRRSELQALRWRDVDLVENVLHVRDSKTQEGIRAIALPPKLAEELWQHRRRTAFQGDDEFVFCHTKRGTAIRAEGFKGELEKALRKAGIHDRVRAFHDLRHTAITADASVGSGAIAVMAKAGHRNMATTRTYLHLAGTVFRDEAERLEQRLLSTPVSTHLSEPQPTSDDGNRLNTRVPE